MKKSKYISKYDYIAYYTKPKCFWFYTNVEIESSLETIYKKLSNSKLDDFYENDETDDNELDDEFDSYQYYLEAKEQHKNVDANNPKIAEGLIIDQKSKEFIISQYQNESNYKIVDFDDTKFKYKKMEELANLTKELITTNKNLILFQGVFIKDNTITKPDAFIKSNYDITIIETKGTSSIKKQHFLDIFYQKNVIEEQQYLIDNNCIYDYKFCLVKYEPLEKYNVSFVLTDYINHTKTYADNSIVEKAPFELKQKLKEKAKIGFHIVEDSTPNDPNGSTGVPLRLKKILNGDFSDMEERMNTQKTTNKNGIIKAKEDFENVINNYNQVIEELWQHKMKMKETDFVEEIKPNKNDKSRFKNFDYFQQERKIYSLMGYKRFDYSGNIAIQSYDVLDNVDINEDPQVYIKETKKKDNKCNFKDLFIYSHKKFDMDYQRTLSLINKIKTNKVYFDFESINTAIRSLDDSLPFAQIITQCSIIKDLGNGIENAECNNMIIDPQKIDDQWLKDVVDNIYSLSEKIPKCEDGTYDICYIVYNKTFESSRLKEIALKLKDPIYTEKINHINDHIFDIAEFFALSTSKGIAMFFEELKGFYSIKKVLPLISKYAGDIFIKTKCLDYNSLEVKNGVICQEKTVQRFFDKVNDKEWKEIEKELKIYCENDVRAMIAVEYFVKDLFNNKISIE